MKEIIAQKINSIFENHQTNDGRQLYSLLSTSHINTGDEAELTTMIWTRNQPESTPELDQLDSDICNEITKITLENEFQITESTGLFTQWKTEYNDWIRLQITDHSIYLIIMNSGQY